MDNIEKYIYALDTLCQLLFLESAQFATTCRSLQAELESLQTVLADEFTAVGYIQAKEHQIQNLKQQFIQRLLDIEQ